jgi:hypothetical protein
MDTLCGLQAENSPAILGSLYLGHRAFGLSPGLGSPARWAGFVEYAKSRRSFRIDVPLPPRGIVMLRECSYVGKRANSPVYSRNSSAIASWNPGRSAPSVRTSPIPNSWTSVSDRYARSRRFLESSTHTRSTFAEKYSSIFLAT